MMSDDAPFLSARITIVGVGLIGGSLGLAFKRRGIGREIVGVSRAETLHAARKLGAIDTGFEYDQLPAGVSESELVILSTPISRILELLPEVVSEVSEGALITDVGSTKREIVASASSLKRKGVHFIGGHPMAGSERTGVTAADPFLFENAIYVVTPTADVPDAWVDRLTGLTRRLGARPMRIGVRAHDRVMAAVSHLPQLMATALVEMIGRLHEADGIPLEMAAGGFRDLTRVASSPYEMWRDICKTNAGPIREMIDLYLAGLGDLRDRVDADELAGNFRYANEIRGSIPKDSKGFLHSLHEILLIAEDRPGVIAGVAGALSSAGINIVDIEVLKVREREGGTIRVGFDTRETAERALAILDRAGYQVRRR